MALLRIGVFETPKGLESFGLNGPKIFDLRKSFKGDVAEWFVLQHQNLETFFVLKDTKENSMGRFYEGSKYLKWNLSINQPEDVFLADWWPGSDVSRSGRHGTQNFAYLATDLQEADEFRLSGGAYTGSLGMDDFVKKSKSGFPETEHWDLNTQWYGLGLIYRRSYSHECGYSSDHMRMTTITIPAKAYIVLNGEKIHLGEELSYEKVAEIVRQKIDVLPTGFEEILLVEDFIRASQEEQVDIVSELFDFYINNNQISEHSIVARYCELKAKEIKDAQEGAFFNFSGYKRRMGMANNGDLWVIKPDGSLREADDFEQRKSYPEGTLRWHKVLPDEVALEWHCDSLRNVAGTSTFNVVARPVNLTSGQLKTVKSIELEIEAPKNAFGLDGELAQEEKWFLHELKKVMTFCPACGKKHSISLGVSDARTMKGESGLFLCDEKPVAKMQSLYEYEGKVSNREAQVVREVKIPQGVLAFVTYYKFGRDNLNVIFRNYNDGEVCPVNVADSLEADKAAEKEKVIRQKQARARKFELEKKEADAAAEKLAAKRDLFQEVRVSSKPANLDQLSALADRFS